MRTAFRIVAGAAGTLALVFSVPFAIASFFDEEQDIHLVHNLGGLAVYGAILGIGLLALSARPERSVAIFQGLALASVGALIGGLRAGDLVQSVWFGPAVIILILFGLFPERTDLLKVGRPRPAFLVLVVLAAVPLVAYALTQARLQSEGLAANPHVDLHHYGGMAVGALMLLLFAVAPALGASGWRLAAWIAGVSMAVIAVGSLVYADHESALDATWAWLGLGWAVAFVAVERFESRRENVRGA